MTAPILVLSANSNIGFETARRLLERRVPVRAAARGTTRTPELTSHGAEVVYADLNRPETLGPALAGVEAVLLSTAADRDIAAQHARLAAAAQQAGVRHIVRISAIGADPESPLGLARGHGEAEQQLERGGVAFTHIRPHTFMQNFLASARSVAAQGRIYSCMGQGRVAHVDLRDIAAVAEVCLTQPGHAGKTYLVTGPEALTMEEVAARIGGAIGRKVEHVNIPPDAWVSGAIAAGLEDWLAMDLAYLHSNVFAKNLASEVSTAVRELTGTPGITVERFARDYAAAFTARAWA